MKYLWLCSTRVGIVHSILHFRKVKIVVLLDIIEDSEAEEPEAKIMMESMSEEVNGALDTLSERERIVLEMYFGQ